jgi:WD40 repeat protein
MLAVRAASRHPIARVAFSPCGRWLACAQPQTGVALHDRASGEVVRTLGNPRRGSYTSVLFLNGSGWIAASGPKGLEVLDVESGRVVYHANSSLSNLQLGVHGDAVLAGCSSMVLELFIPPRADGTSRRQHWSNRHVGYPAVAPDAAWAVGYRSGGNPTVVDLRAGRMAHALRHPARISVDVVPAGHLLPSAAFAPSAPRVALVDGATVTVFDLLPADPSPAGEDIPAPRPVEEPRFALAPPAGWPAGQPWRPAVALTPDGRKLLVKRPRERVQLWDIDAGTLDAEWSWRLEGITCLAVAPDGLTAVAGGRFGRVLTWDLD